MVGILVTVGCLAWVLKDIQWSDVGTSLAQAKYQWIPAYFLCLVGFFWLKAIRWAWLLEPIKKVSPSDVGGPMMIGFMGNNILPGHIGEFFRIYILGRQEQISAVSVFTSVAVERILDIIAVLILVGISLLGIARISPELQSTFLTIGVIALGGVLLFGIGLIWLKQAVALTTGLVHRLPLSAAKAELLCRLITSGSDGMEALRRGKMLLLVLANSLVQWGCNIGMIYLSLVSFGIETTPLAAFLLLGVLVFAVTIPSTPGFFGLVQVAFVETLKLFEVAESTSFAASIFYHLLQYIPVTLVGLWFLAKTGLSLTELQHDAEDVEESLEHPESETGTADAET